MLASTCKKGSILFQKLSSRQVGVSKAQKHVYKQTTVSSNSKKSTQNWLKTYCSSTVGKSATEEATRKWNIHLNKFLKLRYYDEGTKEYEKMKAEGVSPDTTTFMIMFDTYLSNADENSIDALFADVTARGYKTFIQQADAQINELLDERQTRDQALQLHAKINNYRRAGLNLFDPPK